MDADRDVDIRIWMRIRMRISAYERGYGSGACNLLLFILKLRNSLKSMDVLFCLKMMWKICRLIKFFPFKLNVNLVI